MRFKKGFHRLQKIFNFSHLPAFVSAEMDFAIFGLVFNPNVHFLNYSSILDFVNIGYFVDIQTVPGLIDQPLHRHVPCIHGILGVDLVAVPELIDHVVDIHFIGFDFDFLLFTCG